MLRSALFCTHHSFFFFASSFESKLREGEVIQQGETLILLELCLSFNTLLLIILRSFLLLLFVLPYTQWVFTAVFMGIRLSWTTLSKCWQPKKSGWLAIHWWTWCMINVKGVVRKVKVEWWRGGMVEILWCPGAPTATTSWVLTMCEEL